jgi:hypothetical protein
MASTKAVNGLGGLPLIYIAQKLVKTNKIDFVDYWNSNKFKTQVTF